MSILVMIKAYLKSKKYDLQPPIPVFQKEQFEFLSFLREQSKNKKYIDLKYYHFTLISLQILAGVIFIAMICNI